MVVSGSMEPEIHVGALAYVNTKDTDVNTGDVIAFTEGSGEKITVIHRVIEEKSNGTFVTKGDANADKDFAPITQNQITGTIVYNIPYLGYVTSYLQSMQGIIIAVTLIVIALISSFITDSTESKQLDSEESKKINKESVINNEKDT
jgi:signal peptidase